VERRAQLLRAAAVAFSRGGFAVTSMEDVAAEAGVTKLIVYRHFESKEDLYRAVLEEMVVQVKGEFLLRINRAPDRGTAIRSMLAVARDNPAGFRLLMWHAPREPQFEETVKGYWDDSVDAVDRMLGDRITHDTMRYFIVPRLWLYLVHSVLLWMDTGDEADDDQFVETATTGLEALFQVWGDPSTGDSRSGLQRE
jgi:AcrR family transcriptional regulator